MEGLIEQKQYKRILQVQLVESANYLNPNQNWIFQQDNDHEHTASQLNNI